MLGNAQFKTNPLGAIKEHLTASMALAAEPVETAKATSAMFAKNEKIVNRALAQAKDKSGKAPIGGAMGAALNAMMM